MSKGYVVPDGNELIAEALPVFVDLVAHTARWAHPDAFRALPVWYPWAARGRKQYDRTWTALKASGRIESNVKAKYALLGALGVTYPYARNWTVCHIWGYDDDSFASGSNVLRDPRYYSCIGNMVWVPTALKAVTDCQPQVKLMLRTCAYYLYGFCCDLPEADVQSKGIRDGFLPEGYPDSWPAPGRETVLPLGTAPFSELVQRRSAKQLACIRRSLGDEGLTHFPRDEVDGVISYWDSVLPGSPFTIKRR